MSDAQSPAPGWYPDATGVQRWWDGTQWTARTQTPAGAAPVGLGRTRIPEGTRVDTAWTWIVALSGIVAIPLVFLIDLRPMTEAIAAGDEQAVIAASLAITMTSLLVSLASFVVMAVYIVAAYRDYKHLVAVGVVRPFHWAFAFLGPYVYLIGRHVVLRKVIRTSGAPLWVAIALWVVAFIVAIWWTVWITQMMFSGILEYAG